MAGLVVCKARERDRKKWNYFFFLEDGLHLFESVKAFQSKDTSYFDLLTRLTLLIVKSFFVVTFGMSLFNWDWPKVFKNVVYMKEFIGLSFDEPSHCLIPSVLSI